MEMASTSPAALAHLVLKSAKIVTASSDDPTDDGYDQSAIHPDEHPTPDNMWNFSETHCDLSCALYTSFAGFMLFTHLAVMVGPLHGWANGNLILLFKSALTVIQFLNSLALVWSPAWYWRMDISYRRTAFFFALIDFVGWVTSFFGEAIRARRGNTPLDTNQEIIMAYLIVMSGPEALLSLGTLVWEMLDGELSPTGHSKHRDETELTPHDGGHLP